MQDQDQNACQTPSNFFDGRNLCTRIDVFEEPSTTWVAALKQFFRHLGAPQYVDEVLLPTLELGDTQVFCAVRDRPWPPWGLGARTISAVCEAHEVAPESWAISPVYIAEEDVTNVGLVCAIYKEVLQSLAISKTSEVCYLAVEGSVLADYALSSVGFRRDEDVFLTEKARYFTYRASAGKLLKQLKLEKLTTPDLLAHDFSEKVLATNALFHQSIQLGARAELINDRLTAEIISMGRGGHASKPGGVPGGTGITGNGTDHIFPGGDFPYVSLNNFFGSEQTRLLDEVIIHQSAFKPATVLASGQKKPTVDERMRKALTLDDVGFIEKAFLKQLKGVLKPALERMGITGFPVGRIELQITASGNRDYYRMHRDADSDSTREISFVYFLHSEPRRFSGGELRLYDDKRVSGKAHADCSLLLSPRQDMLVIFPSRTSHELLPVRVPSEDFADSRFTINGWIHKAQKS